jgi:hypothetical protein
MRSARSYERQIDKLFAIIEKQNDRIMYLAGATWQQPPAQDVPVPADPFEDIEARYTHLPERDPAY